MDILAIFAWPESAKMLVRELPTPGDGDSSRAALSTLAGRLLRGSGPFSALPPWGQPRRFVAFSAGSAVFYPARGISPLFRAQPAEQAGLEHPCPYRGSRTVPAGVLGFIHRLNIIIFCHAI